MGPAYFCMRFRDERILDQCIAVVENALKTNPRSDILKWHLDQMKLVHR